MKKVIAAGVALLAAAGAAAPYFSGMRAESVFRKNLDAISEHPQLDMEVVRYQRSWLGAEAQTKLKLNLEMEAYSDTELEWLAPGEPLILGLRHSISHGPTPATPALAEVVTTPIVPEEHREAFAHYFGDKAPMTLELRIGLTGGQHLTLSSPPFHGPSLENPEAQIRWQGLKGTADIARGGDSATFHLEAPGLDVTGEKANFTLNRVSIDSDLHRQAGDLWLGETELVAEGAQIDERTAEDGDPDHAVLRGLRIRQHISRENDAELLRLQGSWELDQATIDEQALRDATLALELRHLDAEVSQEFKRRFEDLQRQALPQEEMANRTLVLVQELLPRFLERSPEMAITDLSFDAPQGEFQGSARARFDAGEESVEEAFANPALLLQRVTAHAEARMAKPLLTFLLQTAAEKKAAKMAGPDTPPEQVKQMANRIVRTQLNIAQAMGFLVADGDHFTTAADWEKGRITINGKPLGLSQGMGPGGGGATPPGAPGMP